MKDARLLLALAGLMALAFLASLSIGDAPMSPVRALAALAFRLGATTSSTLWVCPYWN